MADQNSLIPIRDENGRLKWVTRAALGLPMDLTGMPMKGDRPSPPDPQSTEGRIPIRGDNGGVKWVSRAELGLPPDFTGAPMRGTSGPNLILAADAPPAGARPAPGNPSPVPAAPRPPTPAQQAQLRARAERYLQNPNVRAFLNTIGFGEGADYNSLFGNRPTDRFSDYTAFPGTGRPNTASGKYQILEPTYKGLSSQMGLTDFSPHTQDLMAVELLIQNSAMPWVLSGSFPAAALNAAQQWGGIPEGPLARGNPDASGLRGVQHPKPYGDVLTKYQSEIARLTGSQP